MATALPSVETPSEDANDKNTTKTGAATTHQRLPLRIPGVGPSQVAGDSAWYSKEHVKNTFFHLATVSPMMRRTGQVMSSLTSTTAGGIPTGGPKQATAAGIFDPLTDSTAVNIKISPPRNEGVTSQQPTTTDNNLIDIRSQEPAAYTPKSYLQLQEAAALASRSPTRRKTVSLTKSDAGCKLQFTAAAAAIAACTPKKSATTVDSALMEEGGVNSGTPHNIFFDRFNVNAGDSSLTNSNLQQMFTKAALSIGRELGDAGNVCVDSDESNYLDASPVSDAVSTALCRTRTIHLLPTVEEMFENRRTLAQLEAMLYRPGVDNTVERGVDQTPHMHFILPQTPPTKSSSGVRPQPNTMTPYKDNPLLWMPRSKSTDDDATPSDPAPHSDYSRSLRLDASPASTTTNTAAVTLLSDLYGLTTATQSPVIHSNATNDAQQQRRGQPTESCCPLLKNDDSYYFGLLDSSDDAQDNHESSFSPTSRRPDAVVVNLSTEDDDSDRDGDERCSSPHAHLPNTAGLERLNLSGKLIDKFANISPYPPTPTPVHSADVPLKFHQAFHLAMTAHQTSNRDDTAHWENSRRGNAQMPFSESMPLSDAYPSSYFRMSGGDQLGSADLHLSSSLQTSGGPALYSTSQSTATGATHPLQNHGDHSAVSIGAGPIPYLMSPIAVSAIARQTPPAISLTPAMQPSDSVLHQSAQQQYFPLFVPHQQYSGISCNVSPLGSDRGANDLQQQINARYNTASQNNAFVQQTVAAQNSNVLLHHNSYFTASATTTDDKNPLLMSDVPGRLTPSPLLTTTHSYGAEPYNGQVPLSLYPNVSDAVGTGYAAFDARYGAFDARYGAFDARYGAFDGCQQHPYTSDGSRQTGEGGTFGSHFPPFALGQQSGANNTLPTGTLRSTAQSSSHDGHGSNTQTTQSPEMTGEQQLDPNLESLAVTASRAAVTAFASPVLDAGEQSFAVVNIMREFDLYENAANKASLSTTYNDNDVQTNHNPCPFTSYSGKNSLDFTSPQQDWTAPPAYPIPRSVLPPPTRSTSGNRICPDSSSGDMYGGDMLQASSSGGKVSSGGLMGQSRYEGFPAISQADRMKSIHFDNLATTSESNATARPPPPNTTGPTTAAPTSPHSSFLGADTFLATNNATDAALTADSSADQQSLTTLADETICTNATKHAVTEAVPPYLEAVNKQSHSALRNANALIADVSRDLSNAELVHLKFSSAESQDEPIKQHMGNKDSLATVMTPQSSAKGVSAAAAATSTPMASVPAISSSTVSPSTAATTPDASSNLQPTTHSNAYVNDFFCGCQRAGSSVGAGLHPVNCKPCAFVWTKGCINGKDCQFCHEWHLPKKKKPMKDQKNLMIIARPDGKIEFLRCTIEEALRVCY